MQKNPEISEAELEMRRNYNVFKLAKTIFPDVIGNGEEREEDYFIAFNDPQKQNFLSYARKIEIDLFDRSDSLMKYFSTFNDKLHKIQKERDDVRRRREEQQARVIVKLEKIETEWSAIKYFLKLNLVTCNMMGE